MDGDPPLLIKMDMGEMESLHKSSSQHHFVDIFISILAYGKQVALLLRVAECKLAPARFVCDLRVRSFKDILNLTRMGPSDLVRRPFAVPLLLRNILPVESRCKNKISAQLPIEMQEQNIRTAISRNSTPCVRAFDREIRLYPHPSWGTSVYIPIHHGAVRLYPHPS